MKISGPPSVEAGETLEVSTFVTGSCDPSMFYAVRVDLQDARSSQVFSSVTLPYAPVSAYFTVTITNQATAPTTLGFWALQINAYLLAGVNGGVVANSQQLFTVYVTPYTTPTTTQTVITNSTSSLLQTSVNSTTQTTTILTGSSSSVATSTSSVAAPTYQTSTVAIIAVAVVILAVFIVLMLFRRRHAAVSKSKETGNVKYCSHCGGKLQPTDMFCTLCGTKQT